MKFTGTLFAAALLYFCTLGTAAAQPYSSAIGARLGVPLAASYKTFINEDSAVEGYVAFRSFSANYSWISLNGAYQVHNDISGVNGLQWYYGAGAGILFFNFDDNFIGDNSTNTTFSLSGYIGLDYRFADAPINLSVDWIPTYFFSGFGSGFGGGYGSLAVRYILGE